MTNFYVVQYNRATRHLDGLDEFKDFDAAKLALEAAELANLGQGDEVEIALVPADELPKFLGPGDVVVPTAPTVRDIAHRVVGEDAEALDFLSQPDLTDSL